MEVVWGLKTQAQHQAEAGTQTCYWLEFYAFAIMLYFLFSFLYLCLAFQKQILPLTFLHLAPPWKDSRWSSGPWISADCPLMLPPALHTYLKQALVRILVTRAKNEKRKHFQTWSTTAAWGRGTRRLSFMSRLCSICRTVLDTGTCLLHPDQKWFQISLHLIISFHCAGS